MALREDVKLPQATRERFAEIARRKLAERGYSGEALEAKLQEIMARIDWTKATEPHEIP